MWNWTISETEGEFQRVSNHCYGRHVAADNGSRFSYCKYCDLSLVLDWEHGWIPDPQRQSKHKGDQDDGA